MREDSCKFTAFSTPWSLYEWVRIPYGLMNAPSSFQRFINDSLYAYRDKICIAYLDDILIYGRTFNEAKRNVKTILHCLRKKGVKLNPKKCEFMKQEVRYLGRLISKDGYRPDPENSAALEACKIPPQTVGKLRSLLGFLGYYRIFVKNFSQKMKPVYDLLKIEKKPKSDKSKKYLESRRKIIWLPEHQRIVEDMVKYLQSPEVIAYPDFNEPFMLHCDASQMGLGAVLYQKQQGKTRVVSFASRTLSPAERNYHLHSGKLEFLALKWAICDKFSDYLHYGPAFEVFTDNNPLTYLLTTAKLNASGMRWVAQLANYQFSIKYRAGKENIDADYLSRHHPSYDFDKRASKCDKLIRPDDINVIFNTAGSSEKNVSVSYIGVNALNVAELSENPLDDDQIITADELKLEQLKDEIIKPVYDALLSGKKRLVRSEVSRASQLLFGQKKKLTFQNGVLVRKTISRTQIVLPKTFHSLVFEELHEKLGHLGPEKVVELARKRFYWPYMQKDIETHIRKKCRCIISKKPNVPDKAPLVPISATYPFELVSIDYLHLDRCKGGYEYALVICDHFTRFVQVYPTKNKGAKAAADAIFNKFILNFGFPRRIHHDQGTEFNNELFHRLQTLSGIRASRTTPYHPMGDGQPERMNRTLLNMLKCLAENEKNNWKDHFAKLSFAYNSTVNKSTGFSPFFLMFGREPRLPIDLMFGIDLGRQCKSKTYDQFVNDWEKSMKQAMKIANKHLDTGKASRKRYYDKKVKGTEIRVGDNVLYKNRAKGGTGKLRSFWEDQVYEVIHFDPELPVVTIKAGGKEKKVHRNDVMGCNLLVNPDKNEEPVKPVKSVPKKKKASQRRRAPVIHESSLSSSSEEIVVRESFSSEGERSEVDNVSEPVRIHVSIDDSEVSEPVVDFERSEPESVPASEPESVPASEPEPVPVSEPESVPESEPEVNESSSESDSNEPVRRSSRARTSRRMLTYDAMGIPSYR